MATDERRKGSWATPLAIFVMTTVTIYVGYSADRELHHIDGRFDEVGFSLTQFKQDNKEQHNKLWEMMTSYQSRINCLSENLARCCPNAPNCI